MNIFSREQGNNAGYFGEGILNKYQHDALNFIGTIVPALTDDERLVTLIMSAIHSEQDLDIMKSVLKSEMKRN